jgi:hypothetical protein
MRPTPSDTLLILYVTLAAGILMMLLCLLAYVVVHSYDPSLSCGKLHDEAFEGRSEIPTNLDAWNDYELVCGAPPLS